MGDIIAVVGGQFGSEGKGAVAAYLGRNNSELAAVRVAGPNAGHSALDDTGRKWALRQIPVVAVTNRDARLVIGAGSEIDEEVLAAEIQELDAAGFGVTQRLYVDGQATMVTSDNKEDESDLVGRIGSTGKGIGAARAARIMRQAPLWSNADTEEGPIKSPNDTAWLLRTWLGHGFDVLIEGTQGYGLGLHAGYYPHCTSSDCRAVDFMSMAGLSPWGDHVGGVETVVVLRTYPIRVAGNSGPMVKETTWGKLGQETNGYIQPEYTTVTKKMRRVGEWDTNLAAAAVAANGGSRASVALTFFDYWFPELAGATSHEVLDANHWSVVVALQKMVDSKVILLGTGPGSMIDLRQSETRA